MDDLEFRRRLLADPNDTDPELLDTKKQSAANRHFAHELQQLDQQIAQALKVDIPENLADRILFHQSSQEKTPFSYKRYLSYGLAASIIFCLGLFIGQQQSIPTPASESMATIALQHVTEETPFIQPLNENVTLQQVNAKLQPFHSMMNQLPGHVYYLNHCQFGNKNALHMVIGTSTGKVTLFIVPQSSQQITTDSDQKYKSVVLPLQNASLIIVGNKEQRLQPIAEKLQSNIHWQI